MIVKNVPHKANSVITARKIWWPRPRYSVSTRMWDGNYSIMEVSVKVSKKNLGFHPESNPCSPVTQSVYSLYHRTHSAVNEEYKLIRRLVNVTL